MHAIARGVRALILVMVARDRSVITQLDEHFACQGTIADFKTTGKYTIQHNDGTSAVQHSPRLL